MIETCRADVNAKHTSLWTAERKFSSLPGSASGYQEIEVGPMSGKSNVVFWLEQHGIPCSDPIVDRVFAKAKSSTTVLTEAEILAEVYR